jgi:hypothetical protein
MRKTIIVTDLTRMQEQRVCVGGYDEQNACIRPVLPHPGIQEYSLYARGVPFVYPFAVVEYDFLQHTPFPPHTEDHIFDPAGVKGCGVLPEDKRRGFLAQTMSPSVATIFQQPIHADVGFYVLDGTGPRSLGTVQPSGPICSAFQLDSTGALKPRIVFVDGAGVSYKLSVTDLTWRYYTDSLRQAHNWGEDALSAELNMQLKECAIFLRIGLARGWSQHPERCYLQVTGIHTFPDYLEGRTFADFAPQLPDDDW